MVNTYNVRRILLIGLIWTNFIFAVTICCALSYPPETRLEIAMVSAFVGMLGLVFWRSRDARVNAAHYVIFLAMFVAIGVLCYQGFPINK